MTQVKINTQVLNLEEVKADLAKHGRMAIQALSKGLLAGGLVLQRESQLIVPIDTAALKNSAKTNYVPGKTIRLRDDKGRFAGGGIANEVMVTYETAYAIYVHENLTARHGPGKVAKFLEKPAKEKRKQIAEQIITTMRQQL